jgi:hypothetical protein
LLPTPFGQIQLALILTKQSPGIIHSFLVDIVRTLAKKLIIPRIKKAQNFTL